MTWDVFIRSTPVLVGGAVALLLLMVLAWEAWVEWREKRR